MVIQSCQEGLNSILFIIVMLFRRIQCIANYFCQKLYGPILTHVTLLIHQSVYHYCILHSEYDHINPLVLFRNTQP